MGTIPSRLDDRSGIPCRLRARSSASRTGTKFDPSATVPMPSGTFVTHFGKHVHFDGAKEEDAVLLIVGEGPGTSTPAEVK